MLAENRIDSATLTSIYDLVSRNYIKANSATLMNREILDLSDRKLSDESASTLSDLLKTLATTSQVRELILRGNSISDIGATKLASSLTASRLIHHLDLSSNRLTTIGLQHLSLILESSGVTSLRLADMPSLGTSSAANPAIPTVAAALGSLTERLRALDLTNTALLCVPALCAALRRGGVIERLTLQNNPGALADPAASRALAALLRECPSLAQLNVARTGLGAAGAGELGGALPWAAGLARLDLSGNDVIGDVGAVAVASGLAGASGLRALRLASCGIGNEGAEAIWKMACNNGSVCAIDLAGNSIGGELMGKINDVIGRNVAGQKPGKQSEVKGDVILTLADTSIMTSYSCKEAFSELCATLCAGGDDEGCAKALEAYYAQVAEKVPTVSGMPRDEALAIALLVSGGYFAEKLAASMAASTASSVIAAATGSAGDQKGKKGITFMTAEARRYLALVNAGLEKLAACGEEEEECTLKFAEKVNTSEIKIGKEIRFGKYIIACSDEKKKEGEGEEEKEKEFALDMDRFEGKTKFSVSAPLAKEVTKFVVLGERKQGQKVFVISPNATFVVVNQAKAEIVEITSNRVRW